MRYDVYIYIYMLLGAKGLKQSQNYLPFMTTVYPLRYKSRYGPCPQPADSTVHTINPVSFQIYLIRLSASDCSSVSLMVYSLHDFTKVLYVFHISTRRVLHALPIPSALTCSLQFYFVTIGFNAGPSDRAV